jgi:hypothetical protein
VIKTRVNRIDVVSSEGLAPPVRLDNGFVRYDAFLAREGCLSYRRADGSTRVEYRPASENADSAVLDSFALVPLTLEHPAGGRVTADNARKYTVGAVERPTVDSDKIRARLLVTDSAAVKAVAAGKVQVSCGYSCDLDETPGTTPDGQRYDAIQREVRGNHVALVDVARAGPSIRLRADSLDMTDEITDSQTKEPAVTIRTIKVDQVDVEVPAALVAHVDSLLATIETATKALETEKARADAAAGEVVKLKTELETLPARIVEAAKVRLELDAVAVRAGVKNDGTDAELRAAIATKVTGVKCDGASVEYVAGLYQAALAQLATATVVKAPTAKISDTRSDSVDPLEAAKARYAAAVSTYHLTTKEV